MERNNEEETLHFPQDLFDYFKLDIALSIQRLPPSSSRCKFNFSSSYKHVSLLDHRTTSRKIQNKRNQKVLVSQPHVDQNIKTKRSKSIKFNPAFSLQHGSSKINVQLSFNTDGPKLVGLSYQ